MTAVLTLLREAPGGQTEHALIVRLRDQGVAPFADADLADPMALFRTHFILFHSLYRLREQLAAQGEWLRIHCLDIGIDVLTPDSDGASGRAVAAGDPLRDYYLDLDNLDTMDRATVEAMLSGFWRRLDAGERRHEALELLGLEEPAGVEEVTRRYRQLAQQHHPDKGGDTETLQRLNEARMVLTTEQ
nr:DNA-J related domain-containing protein [Aquisalimonas asiatica]